MTEAEALEVAGIFSSNAITAFSVYITFTMAYLVASFYAGSRLTNFQAIVVSMLYVFAATSTMLSLTGSVSVYGAAMEQSAIGQVTPFANGFFWILFMSILMSLGIVVSLFFMWSIRQSKK